MSEIKTILRIEGLCVDFDTRRGSIRVLNSVGFQLMEGETLGIVGESGCGKSMTALSIMRLVPQPLGRISRGKILLRGHDLLAIGEKQMRDIRGKEISMIFQEPMTSLNPVFTVGGQIAETMQRHQDLSRSAAFEKAIEMLRMVKIPAAEKSIHQYPHQLSGGMRQRIMIAMALSCQPSVLIADEPTTALDVTVQAQIFDLFLEIQEKTDTGIILITHDMAVIAEVAQRVVVMYAGYRVEEGPVWEIINNPCHPYTQGLIKCIPRLHAEPGPDRVELMEIPGIVPDLSRLGSDCPFRPRCNYAMDKCTKSMPPLTEAGEKHYVACWLMV